MCPVMMNDEDHARSAASFSSEGDPRASREFDLTEEAWFARPERTTRRSQRPTLPAPAAEGPIDPAIDGWFFDVTT